MNCRHCGAEIPDGQLYCGQCGSPAKADSLENVRQDLETMRRRLEEEFSRAKGTEQRFLEMDTAQKVVTRVMTRTKQFLFVAGIPLLILGVIVGKNLWDLREVATTARESITPLLEKARSDAISAQTIATDALQTSKEVRSLAEQTRQQLSDLKTDVQKLKSDAQALAAAITTQSKDLKAVAQQVKTVTTEKNTQLARDIYPALLGERVARSQRGTIVPSEKGSQNVYVSLSLWSRSGQQSKLDANKVGQVMTSLGEHNYTVFEGGVRLEGTSGNSFQTLGLAISDNSCQQFAKLDPPCILYLRKPLQAKANEVRGLIRFAQIVPDDRIKFVDPMTLDAGIQELIQKSGVDMVVVLSG